MPTYVIGDVQGCFEELEHLLELIAFNPQKDKLWFAGDLVNRGPQSLEVLRFVKALGDSAITILGNHDLHLIAVREQCAPTKMKDTLSAILQAKDCDELCDWLRQQKFLHHDETLGFTLVHAGLPPQWTLAQAISCAREIETALQSNEYQDFLKNMYGNEPNQWDDTLQSWGRLRFITNCFTRIRFCDIDGRLDLQHKGKPGSQKLGFIPWYQIPHRKSSQDNIIFGHWAALQGQVNEEHLFAVDTGCIWGNKLSAFCLEDKKWYQTACKGIENGWSKG